MNTETIVFALASALAIYAVHTRFPLTSADIATRVFDWMVRPWIWLARLGRRPQPAA